MNKNMKRSNNRLFKFRIIGLYAAVLILIFYSIKLLKVAHDNPNITNHDYRMYTFTHFSEFWPEFVAILYIIGDYIYSLIKN